MTIIGTHRGPISGITHVHLLRESAAVRKARLVAQEAKDPETGKVGGADEGHAATERDPEKNAGRQ
jgi:hypothetical protein